MATHFVHNLQHFGKRCAVVLPDGQLISYQQLTELADQYAQNFIQYDVWPQQICALQCHNNLSTVVAYLCCLRQQRPLLLLDPKLSAEQLNHIFRQLEVAVLIDGSGQMQRVSPSRFRARNDLALLMCTSGSCGDAKTVMLTLDNLQHNAHAITKVLPIHPDDTAITVQPLHSAYGLSVLNSHLLAGARIVLNEHSVAQKEFWALMRKFQVDGLSGLPYTYQLLQKLRFELLPLPALRYLTQAGGALTADSLEYLQQVARQRALDVFLMYGQTEATARITCLSPEQLFSAGHCIGAVLPGGELYLQDPKTGERVTTPYQEAELVYHGGNVMLGYAQQASDLRSSTQLTTLHTGDLAVMLPSGLLQITGRLKRMIKIQGVRWQLDQLEQQFQREKWQTVCTGSDDALLIAVVDTDAKSTLVESVSRWLKPKIASRYFKVVLIRDIPYTASGKVNYEAIKRLAHHGDAQGPVATEGYL